MRARIYVHLKPTVLDPQGQTIRRALNSLGHQLITEVRQGKVFDIMVADGLEREAALRELEEIAREVLSNPVIEEYRVEMLD
jgi:phosphoribosylformylglycinamidine synthase